MKDDHHDPDANHGAGTFTYIETPSLCPSFVGQYSSTMLRIRDIVTLRWLGNSVRSSLAPYEIGNI